MLLPLMSPRENLLCFMLGSFTLGNPIMPLDPVARIWLVSGIQMVQYIWYMHIFHEAHVQTLFLNTPAPPVGPCVQISLTTCADSSRKTSWRRQVCSREQIHMLIKCSIWLYMLHIHFPFVTLASSVQAALHIIAGQLNEDPLVPLGLLSSSSGFW